MSGGTWTDLLGGVGFTLVVTALGLLTAMRVEVRRLEAARQRWEAAVAQWERAMSAPDSGRERDRAVMELLLTALRAVLQATHGSEPAAASDVEAEAHRYLARRRLDMARHLRPGRKEET